MKLSMILEAFDAIVLSGPIKTRLEFECNVHIPPSELIGHPKEGILKAIFEQDIRVAQKYKLPIIVPTTTFRASINHLNKRDKNPDALEKINRAAVNFIKQLQKELESSISPVITAAPVGSMGDAYDASHAPDSKIAEVYHDQQIRILSDTEIDYIDIVTIPSLSEALGIARSAEKFGKEYTIGFILNSSGLILDGNTLETAIQTIDSDVRLKPIGYMLYCTYPTYAQKILLSRRNISRLIGIKANASALSLRGLDTVARSEADDPSKFVDELILLREKLGLKILGGCCGTSLNHLSELVKRIHGFSGAQ